MISGPGVWVMCVKGKEKQSIGELYDLFESVSVELSSVKLQERAESKIGQLAEELWPQNAESRGDDEGNGVSDAEEEEDIEKAIAKEVQKIKRPRKEQRFGESLLSFRFYILIPLYAAANCTTDTPCGENLSLSSSGLLVLMRYIIVIFISCKPPVDPVQLVDLHMKNVERTGVTHTRYVPFPVRTPKCQTNPHHRNVLRLIPVSRSCDANLPEIINLSKRVVLPAFENSEGKSFRVRHL